MNTVKDWEVEAGLKEEPKPKKLDQWTRYIPSLSELASGVFFISLGLLALRGGGFAIQTNPDSEPIWILQNYTLPGVVCWLLVWIGIDTAAFKGRATAWIFMKFIVPVLEAVAKATFGEEKLNAWKGKVERVAKKAGSE